MPETPASFSRICRPVVPASPSMNTVAMIVSPNQGVETQSRSRAAARFLSAAMQFLQQALDGRQAGLQLGVLGLNPVDVGVQGLDLARRDVRAGEVVEGGSQGAGFLVQNGEPAVDQRQAVELGA